MEKLTQEIGRKIKVYRKKRNLNLQDLANRIYKSKATISKYENGQIAVDIVTLYDIARVLGVHVEQLLYSEPDKTLDMDTNRIPSFFRGITRFYMYYYDGRRNVLNRSVIDITAKTENNTYKVMLYMNIDTYDGYQNCENTYWGYLIHYDSLSTMILHNQDTRTEQITINMLATFLDTSVKWGLFCGISSRPLMPIATKILITKKQQQETKDFINQLKVSREDIRLFKLYNMFSVM
jgi:transcriptional regulator with XRE-family HTH domain